MSNELLFVAVATGAVIALLLGRFAVLHDPATVVLQRVGQVVRDADPDLLARVSLQELQRPGDPVRPADE